MQTWRKGTDGPTGLWSNSSAHQKTGSQGDRRPRGAPPRAARRRPPHSAHRRRPRPRPAEAHQCEKTSQRWPLPSAVRRGARAARPMCRPGARTSQGCDALPWVLRCRTRATAIRSYRARRLLCHVRFVGRTADGCARSDWSGARWLEAIRISPSGYTLDSAQIAYTCGPKLKTSRDVTCLSKLSMETVVPMLTK